MKPCGSDCRNRISTQVPAPGLGLLGQVSAFGLAPQDHGDDAENGKAGHDDAPNDVPALVAVLEQIAKETRERITDLRTEMRQDFADLRVEMRTI
jgi:hypothetical protein